MPDPYQPNYAGAIYGTIISMTVIATASKDPGLSNPEIAIWAAATGLVFWLVHVYADIVAGGYSTAREAVGHARGAFKNQWPIVQGAAIPALVMVIAPLFAINDENVSYWAVGGGIVMLFATGLFIGAREGRSWRRRLIVGIVNAVFGIVILGLKIYIH